MKVSPGGTLTTLANFYSNTNGNTTLSGSNPQCSLVQGPDGNFYGTTNNGGGSNGYGSVFKMTPAGQVSTLVNFNYSAAPIGANRRSTPNPANPISSRSPNIKKGRPRGPII